MNINTCKILSLGEVENIINTCLPIKPMFNGVYSFEQLDKVSLNSNTYAIICTLKLNEFEKVGHFYVVYMTKYGDLEVFDSLGQHLSCKQLKAFLNKNAKKEYKFVLGQLQSLQSVCCSYYCLYYIYHRCVYNFSLEEIIRSFNGKTHQELDKMVYQFCKNYILNFY